MPLMPKSKVEVVTFIEPGSDRPAKKALPGGDDVRQLWWPCAWPAALTLAPRLNYCQAKGGKRKRTTDRQDFEQAYSEVKTLG